MLSVSMCIRVVIGWPSHVSLSMCLAQRGMQHTLNVCKCLFPQASCVNDPAQPNTGRFMGPDTWV